jgi:septal ring factor EnvC (AmiA/AmiB activator)
MQITKAFLESEIKELEQELMRANTFIIQAQATLTAYQMLIRRLDSPEQESSNAPDSNCNN